jgi:hypothetical protein
MPETEAMQPSPRDKLLRQLTKLKITLDDRVSYRLESVFAQTTGWGSNAEIKRRAVLINLAAPRLSEMLLENEEVLYVARGVQQVSFAESSFLGASFMMGAWQFAAVNQTIFVLTNLRLLLMRCNNSGKPRETFWVIYYSEISKFKSTWTGGLDLPLKDTRSLTFNGFSSRDLKAMPTIVQESIDRYEQHAFEPVVTQSRENLCSYCYNVVPKGEFDCAACGARFWLPRDLALRSLVFPSWGDFSMKHYSIAFVELIGYALSWIAAINAGLGFVLLILLVEHPFDALMTYKIAHKGLNPRWGPDQDRSGIGRDEADDADELVEVN